MTNAGCERTFSMFIAYNNQRVDKPIGSCRQLFVDDDVIAAVKNVTRRQHTPRKHPANPLVERDTVWEHTPFFRTSAFNVIRDRVAGVFKCWYEDMYELFGGGFQFETPQGVGKVHRNRICYAQSADGITWEKPRLGRYLIDGHDTNTVIWEADTRIGSPTVLLDECDADASQRYKMLYLHQTAAARSGRHGAGLCLATSPDGIEWELNKETPLFPHWGGDVEVLTYDSVDRKYLLFGRAHANKGGSVHPGHAHAARPFPPVWPSRPQGIWGTRRNLYRLESDDLVHWSDPVLVFDPDQRDNLDDSHYGFVPWRAGELQLGILNVFHQVDNTMDMYLFFSRDGQAWHRLPQHRPLLPRGGAGSFDEHMIETPTQPIVVGDEIWLYYGGHSVHHDWWICGRSEGLGVPEADDPTLSQNGHHLALATLRLDGWVSLATTLREGWIETKPVSSAGAHLFINGRCRSGGYIDVAVTDHWDNPWPGFSRADCDRFTGDNVHHMVTWAGRSRISELPFAVKLRFHMRDADLYSFQIADTPILD